jgi:glycerol-3-phosphate dehydrogenase (NAD(P)+)
MKIAIVGAGSWGTAFAGLLREREHDVALLGRERDAGDFAGAALVCVAVPSRVFAEVVRTIPGDAPLVILTKGLDPATGERLSQVVSGRPVAVLSGPNHAEEIAGGLPALAVVASEDDALAELVRDAVMSPRFRVYVNSDLVGVELCAAAKNVIALAAGAVEGLGLGDNAKAALVTRGLAEMTRLGSTCGARPETFAGLAGLGDLVVTCWSRHSRNRRAGELVAHGVSAAEAVAAIGMAVEGVTTAPALRALGNRVGVELPITEGVCAVLGGVRPLDLVTNLMGREPTEE